MFCNLLIYGLPLHWTECFGFVKWIVIIHNYLRSVGRNPCCSQHSEPNRAAWTAQEDYILAQYIKSHGAGRWRSLPQKSGLKRCGKSYRFRWLNYLRPDIKRGNISAEEEELIVILHGLLGNRWKLIAGRLPGRTDNEIKNYWNTHISKRTPQGKETFSSPKCESKFAHPASSQEPKSVPVKTKAVKISNGYCYTGIANYPGINSADSPDITNISESWWNSLVEEYIKEDDSKSLEFSITELAFPSSYYSVQDLYPNNLDQAASSLESNVEQENNFMEQMGIKVNRKESYGISDSKHLEKL